MHSWSESKSKNSWWNENSKGAVWEILAVCRENRVESRVHIYL